MEQHNRCRCDYPSSQKDPREAGNPLCDLQIIEFVISTKFSTAANRRHLLRRPTGRRISPGPGRNPWKASSALIRHSIECPRITMSSCDKPITCVRSRHVKTAKLSRKKLKPSAAQTMSRAEQSKADRNSYLSHAKLLPQSNTNLLLDEISRGDHLRHRVFHLSIIHRWLSAQPPYPFCARESLYRL